MLDISVFFKLGTTDVQALELLEKVGAKLIEKSILCSEVYTALVTEKQSDELQLNSLVEGMDINGDTDIDGDE